MADARTAVLCFGEALIDFLERPPTDAGTPRTFVEHAGGAPANVAVGVARLGGDACFAGMLANDLFGDALFAEFARHGVDTSQVRRTDAAPTALAFVALDTHGERSFTFYRPPAADLLFETRHFDVARVRGAAIFHACSNSLTEPGIAEVTLHGLRLARDGGALASVDLNLRPALWPRGVDPAPVLWHMLALADLVKLSREELAFLAADAPEDAVIARLLAEHAQAVVVTDGAAPIRWWTRTASGTAPTLRVEAVDSTAAGDAFVAGLLQRIAALGIDRARLAQAFEDDATRGDLLRRAAASGAFATTRYGAFAAMPTAADVRALLEAA